MGKIISFSNNDINYIAENFSFLIQDRCVKFSCVIRNIKNISDREQQFLDEMRKHLIEFKNVKEWPGTSLSDGEATIFYYNLNLSSLNFLNTRKSLFAYISPNLPEDICFYLKNDSPFLVTISHEKDLYLITEKPMYQSVIDLLKGKGIEPI